MPAFKAPANGEQIGLPAHAEMGGLRALADPERLRAEARNLRASSASARRALLDTFESREVAAGSEARLRARLSAKAHNKRVWS